MQKKQKKDAQNKAISEAMLMDYVIKKVVQPNLQNVHAYKLANFKNNTELKPMEEVGDLFIDTIKICDPSNAFDKEGKITNQDVVDLFGQAEILVVVEKTLYNQSTNWDWRKPYNRNHQYHAE